MKIPSPVGEKTDFGIGSLLRRAAASERARLERALAVLKLTQGQFALLDILEMADGISSADAARIECLSPQTICVIVQNLERCGAIKKLPHSKGGRVQTLHLLQRGSELLSMGRENLIGFEKRLVSGLPSPAHRAVKEWLSGLTNK